MPPPPEPPKTAAAARTALLTADSLDFSAAVVDAGSALSLSANVSSSDPTSTSADHESDQADVVEMVVQLREPGRSGSQFILVRGPPVPVRVQRK